MAASELAEIPSEPTASAPPLDDDDRNPVRIRWGDSFDPVDGSVTRLTEPLGPTYCTPSSPFPTLVPPPSPASAISSSPFLVRASSRGLLRPETTTVAVSDWPWATPEPSIDRVNKAA